jgi:hypothetical protein
MERDGKPAFTDLTERAFLIRQTDIVRTLTSANCLARVHQFYMPADGVLAAYKRDFGTSRCASRVKDYNSFRRIQNGAQCPLLAQSGHTDPLNQCPLLGVKRTLPGTRSDVCF